MLVCLTLAHSVSTCALPGSVLATAGPAVLPRRSLACSVAPAALMDAYLSIVCDITAALVPHGFQGGGPGWVAAPWVAAPWVVDLRYLGTQILAS
ncbi:hypothetical protein [Pseudomonas phage DL62]|uniref:Uncharacterized protein n=1 Tax=Pseudomonas phage DL62 TaxID=1640972 RepID=A0A0F6WDJ1_9CAUD|nr:hypothetical protein AVU26_gp02 [Pseudomonas phage DL62]AKF13917.1 hypothetical protein [Pseudomonas phage DL62]